MATGSFSPLPAFVTDASLMRRMVAVPEGESGIGVQAGSEIGFCSGG